MQRLGGAPAGRGATAAPRWRAPAPRLAEPSRARRFLYGFGQLSSSCSSGDSSGCSPHPRWQGVSTCAGRSSTSISSSSGSSGGGTQQDSSRSPDAKRQKGGGAALLPLGLHPRQLTGLIKNADSLEQLAALEQQHGGTMNHIHLTAAFNQANKILDRPGGRSGSSSSSSSSSSSTTALLWRLWQRLEPQLDSCDAWGLASIVWASSKVGFAEPALLDSCLQRLAARASEAEPQGLANAVYGAALLSERGCPVRDTAVLQQLAAALVAKRQDADPQALANTLWAVATLGQQLPADHVQQLVAALVDKRQEAAPQALANTLWAAATLGQQLPADQVQQLVAALVARRQEAAPQALANTLWAVATLGQQLPADQVQQLAAALVAKQQDAKPQELSNTLWALAEMRVCLPPLVEQLAAALLQRLAEATPREISNTALALAKLACRSPQLFGGLVEAMQQQLTAQRPPMAQDLANMCWAAAVADQRQCAPQVLALCRRFTADPQLWAAAGEENHSQLHQVHLWLCDWQPPAAAGPSGLAGVLSPAQLQQCTQAWELQLQQTASQQRSELELSVYACARRLGSTLAGCRQEARCDGDGAFSVDVAATHAPTGLRLAIEADGPTHFLEPGRRLTGVTLARNRALAARGHVVVSVPFWEWDALKGRREEEERCLLAAVEAAATAAAAGGGAAAALAAAAAARMTGGGPSGAPAAAAAQPVVVRGGSAPQPAKRPRWNGPTGAW